MPELEGSSSARYAGYDERTQANYLCGDLAEETQLPRELLLRFHQMWHEHERPFFTKVSEDHTLGEPELAEVVRSIGVASELICNSISRVIAAESPRISFEAFCRGYGALHSRTLKQALPFAFKVFDLDGDGVLDPTEFAQVLEESLKLQKLDSSAIARVLAAPEALRVEGESGPMKLTLGQFRYFGSISSETILAACGFMLHVNDFYVPLAPFDAQDEAEDAEAATEAAKRKEHRRLEQERSGHLKRADGADGEAAGEGEAAKENIFEDEDFMAAIESLKSTPEERAERKKNEGNEQLRSMEPKGIEQSVETYTSGLDEHPRDPLLVATLLSNRSAAHTMLKNWGKALADASAAIDMGSLPPATIIKCCRRGAAAAVRLEKLDRARELMELGRSLEGGAEDAELLQVQQKLFKAEATAEEARRKAAREAAEAEALSAALKRRGVKLGDFVDEKVEAQYVGENSGCKIWYDAAADEVHWPLVLLYPEVGQSDFCQDINEHDAVLMHLVEMFGEAGECAPPWDEERKYRARDLQPYVCFDGPEGKQVWQKLYSDEPLIAQLVEKQALGYRIPGIPMVHVWVRGSAYEKEFLRRIEMGASM